MSDKNTTNANQNAKTTIKISISETDARDILNQLGTPVPNELPNKIELIITPEK